MRIIEGALPRNAYGDRLSVVPVAAKKKLLILLGHLKEIFGRYIKIPSIDQKLFRAALSKG